MPSGVAPLLLASSLKAVPGIGTALGSFATPVLAAGVTYAVGRVFACTSSRAARCSTSAPTGMKVHFEKALDERDKGDIALMMTRTMSALAGGAGGGPAVDGAGRRAGSGGSGTAAGTPETRTGGSRARSPPRTQDRWLFHVEGTLAYMHADGNTDGYSIDVQLGVRRPAIAVSPIGSSSTPDART